MICINCGNKHNEKFCPNCGEKSDVPKITFGTILNGFFSTITNMDKGFLFNAKHLLFNPNKIIKDYILGKRKNIFNPISFLIITITIYLIFDSLIKVSGTVDEQDSKYYSAGRETGRFIKTNLKYFWIFSIVWLSNSTKLVFQKYNYAEHLVINSFVIGQATLFGLIGLGIFKFPLILNPVVYVLMIWMIYQIFKGHNKKITVFFQSIGAGLLFIIQLLLIAVLIGIIRSKS